MSESEGKKKKKKSSSGEAKKKVRIKGDKGEAETKITTDATATEKTPGAGTSGAVDSSSGRGGSAAEEDSRRRTIGGLPLEVISHRILTHFDETAGVALSRAEVDQHLRMGNIVTPLVDAYKLRYDKLRTLLTTKLLPKRETVLQLRRQLQHAATEVDAKRRAIERETLTDAEQILERLRAVESLRQSSIRHQVLQLEEQLQVMERVVTRVERANLAELELEPKSGTRPGAGSTLGSGYSGGSGAVGNVLLTSVQPGHQPLEGLRVPLAMNMVELIHDYADLVATIDQLTYQQLQVQIDYPVDDFPRETAERLEIIHRCDQYVHALNVKDQMLWTMMQEKERLLLQLNEEKKLSQEYAQEVAQWAEIAQSLTQQAMQEKTEKGAAQAKIQELLQVLRDNHIYYEMD